MKILHVFNSMNCGGAENMVMNILRCIDRKEFQFDFLVHQDTPAFFDEEIKALGGKIYYIPRWNVLNTRKYIKALYNFFREHYDYSIVHGHMGSSAHLYLKIAKKFGIYTVAHSHNPYPKKFSFKKIFARFTAFKTRRIADYFLACSKAAGLDRFGEKIVNSNRFKVLTNSINTSKYVYSETIRQEIRNKYQLEDKFVVGHIGRFNQEKNHIFLLKVFNEILKQNENSILMLIGSGNLQNKIKEKAKDLKILDKIIFTGVLPNANLYLQAMDCFVFPSFYEGLGMVVVESECLGLPCFVTDTLPCDLDINDNIYRLSLDKSPKIWADCILKNASHKTDNETALNNIRNAGYDVNETIRKTEEIYRFFDKLNKEKSK